MINEMDAFNGQLRIKQRRKKSKRSRTGIFLKMTIFIKLSDVIRLVTKRFIKIQDKLLMIRWSIVFYMMLDTNYPTIAKLGRKNTY